MVSQCLKVALSQVNSLTLNQLLTHQSLAEPLLFSFSEQNLLIDSSLETLTPGLFSNETITPVKKPTDNGWELVVLSQMSVGQLHSLCQLSGVELLSLARINHRLGISSYRFNLAATDMSAAREKINQFAMTENLEIALLHAAPCLTEPGLLIMDMDSTTIEIECIDEIAALAGVGNEVAQVTERAMQGELDFAASLTERVARLAGASESILAEVAANLPLMPGLRPLLEVLKANHWRVAVASGGFTYFTDTLQQQLPLDATQANVLEIVDGTLTGKIIGDITDAQVKADTLTRLVGEFEIPPRQTVAMGDGANDLLMLNAANLGVAYKAKPVVLQQADCAINFSGLDCLVHWLK